MGTTVAVIVNIAAAIGAERRACFRQGFGRLIRTTTDSGIFLSLDNRIVAKRYGEIFLHAIPVEPVIFADISALR